MSAREDFIWSPPPGRFERSNLKRLMDRHEIKTFDELRRRSIKDMEWFWASVSEDLGIGWFVPFSRVLDMSGGKQFPKWFVGGKINIAFNCLDRNLLGPNRTKLALVSESETKDNPKKLTFSDLDSLTNQIANALAMDLGLKKGDKIGVYLPMIPEAVAAFLAVIKMGGVVVPIFSGYGVEAISTRLRDCDAKALVTADGFLRKGKQIAMGEIASKAAELVPSMRSVLFYDNLSEREGPRGSGEFSWECVRKRSKTFITEVMDSEDPFMIIYTSGTTGKPKGAVHVHGGFQVKIAEEVAYQADLHVSDLLFWFTDLGWIMAPWEIVGVLSLGGTMMTYDGAPDYPGPDKLWEIVERNRATIFGVSPTLTRSLMKYGSEFPSRHDLSSLQSFASTGEPWDEQSYNWLFGDVGNKSRPIINLSGGTEVGACFLSVHPILPVKSCSLGGPCLGIDADVVDENGRPIRNHTGELVVRNPWPSMTRGLWKNKELYLETYWSRFKDLWVHGDWASIDSDGYWFLHGRSDDTLKIAGKRVGPAEIEDALASQGSVLESAAIGVPDPIKGEAIACFVVLRPGVAPSEDLKNRLCEHVAGVLGRAMRPKEIEFISALPKTRNAKIVRRLVRASYLGLPLGDMSNLENPEVLELISSAKQQV